MATSPKRKLDTASPTASAEAREQATEYESLFGDVPLILDGGDVVMVPPHPDYSMLDDDKMDEWDELRYRMDTVYDREDDLYVPEQKLDDGVVLPSVTRRGNLKVPYRITTTDPEGNETTQLVKPSHSVKVVQIALGEAEYKRLKDGGRNAADVWKIWGERSLAIQERQQRDSFRASSPVAVAPVSSPNRQ